MTKILKKDGVEIMGECTMPNPLPWWVEQVTQATKEVQREALAQEYAVEQVLEIVLRLQDDAVCCTNFLDNWPVTDGVRQLLEAHRDRCEVGLEQLKGARVVV